MKWRSPIHSTGFNFIRAIDEHFTRLTFRPGDTIPDGRKFDPADGAVAWLSGGRA